MWKHSPTWPFIIKNGADEYKKIGTEQSAGTKLFCVSGIVKKPGVYELPFNTTFRELLVDICEGPQSEEYSFQSYVAFGWFRSHRTFE
jgi:NADH:ubiquinone oxidoreductase subunit F (NADH-binding)